MEEQSAVYIFEQGKLSREMRYSEFEAILDNFAPMPELAAQKVEAVYVQLSTGLQAAAAVFFYISFDSEGFADHRWNIPLQQLAENARRGPDLGGGPIRLACRSQCPIEWHQPNLWDPAMGSKSAEFESLRKALGENRLGFVAELAENGPEKAATAKDTDLQLPQAEAHSQLLDQLKEEGRLRIAAIKEAQQRELDQLKSKFQANLALQRQESQQLQQLVDAERRKNEELKQTIEGQASKIQGVREYFQHKLEAAISSRDESFEDLRAGYEAEIEVRVEAAIAEIREQMQMKEVALVYKETQCASLEDEVKRLQESHQSLLANSGNQLLERLHRGGISFVSFQPGYGHMTLPVDDIPVFLEDTEAYVAEKCGVEKGLYQAWSEHHRNPCCQALASGGVPCGKRVARIERPADFLLGESDRCDEHR